MLLTLRRYRAEQSRRDRSERDQNERLRDVLLRQFCSWVCRFVRGQAVHSSLASGLV